MTMYDRKGDELIATLEQTLIAIADHAYPRLLIVPKSFVSDDDPDDKQVTLFCPRCSEEVLDGTLVAIDWTENWSSAETLVAPFRTVTFTAERHDSDSTLYYRHGRIGGTDYHLVSLPLGSQEAWA